jgi:TPR repeat protein
MHRQRITLIALALLGMGVCFVPWGSTPILGPLKGTGLLQLVAVTLGLSVLVVSFVGPLAMATTGTPNALASLATLLILTLGAVRIVVIGHYWMPSFEENDARAKEYYEEACAAGRIKACVLLGTCYWTGTCGQRKDVDRAVELFQKACAGAEASACGQLAECYDVGGCGLTRSASMAVAMYEKACAGGEMDMCNNLGICYHKGGCGVPRDIKRARVLYSKACDGGYGGACHNLSLIKE